MSGACDNLSGVLPKLSPKVAAQAVSVAAPTGTLILRKGDQIIGAVDATTGKAVQLTDDVLKAVQAEAKGTVNINNAANNAVSYTRLKLDLKTTESANAVVDSLKATGQLPSN